MTVQMHLIYGDYSPCALQCALGDFKEMTAAVLAFTYTVALLLASHDQGSTL